MIEKLCKSKKLSLESEIKEATEKYQPGAGFRIKGTLKIANKNRIEEGDWTHRPRQSLLLKFPPL